MSSDKDRIGIGILIHGTFQAPRQVFLKSSILDNGDPQSIRISQHSLIPTFGYALDLFNIIDLKACGFAMLSFNQKGHKDGPLGMGMDAASRTTIEGS